MRLLFILILIIAITCIQLNQIGNLSLVLSTGGPDWSAVFGYDLKILAGVSWAVGIELGVLVSVLAGAKKQAAVLAAGSCIINLLANQVWEYAPHIAAAKMVIYGLSAYLLWYFCELFAKYYANSFLNWFGSLQEDSVQPAESIANLSVTELKDTIATMDTFIPRDRALEKVAEMAQQIKPKLNGSTPSAKQLACQYCQRADFTSQSQLNAHSGRCKLNPKLQPISQIAI